MKYDFDFYLAGMMAGVPSHNFPLFEFAAKTMRDNGITICSPHELHGPYETLSEANRHVYLRKDISYLVRCEKLVRLPGWKMSRGAQLEIAVAEGLEMPIVDFTEMFPKEFYTWCYCEVFQNEIKQEARKP